MGPGEGRGEDSDLQRLVDDLYAARPKGTVSQMDVVLRAEAFDLEAEDLEVVGLLPPGSYTRGRLCDQLNSIITAHGWGYTRGTVA